VVDGDKEEALLTLELTKLCFQGLSQAQSPESKKASNNRILLRTQSLGSVESWQPQTTASSQEGGCSSVEGRESVDGSSSHGSNRGCVPAAKLKEKEWYETSLDSSGPATGMTTISQQQRAVRRASHHNSLVGPLTKERAPVRSNSIPSNRRAREHQQQQQQQQQQSQQLEEQQQQQQQDTLTIACWKYLQSPNPLLVSTHLVLPLPSFICFLLPIFAFLATVLHFILYIETFCKHIFVAREHFHSLFG
jgi:hypothetical protein